MPILIHHLTDSLTEFDGHSPDVPRILVIDDAHENLEVIGNMLRHEGFAVSLALSAKVALRLLDQGCLPDLILLDIMMPEMDGFQCLARLKANPASADIPVIFLTAIADAEIQGRGLRAGAVDYVTKPINMDILLSRIGVHLELKRMREDLLRQRASLREEIARQVYESRLLESQLQIALESSGFLVWRHDRRSGAFAFTTPVSEVLGYDWQDISTTAYLALVHPEDRAIALRVAAPEAGDFDIGDYRLQHQAGHWVWVEVRSRTLVADDPVTVGTLSDLSERKAQERALEDNLAAQRQLNKRLEEAHNQLLQSEKMASIGQLAAGVAHELNNPIGFVHSNLGTLETYLRDLMAMIDAFLAATVAAGENVSPELAAAQALCEARDLGYIRDDIFDLLAESKDGLNRLRKIVQDLKTFSRVGEQDWQEADLHQGLDSTLNIVWNELKYKCTVNKEYGDIPPVFCLISQLNQVFMNLLVNAGQAIEKQGTITLRTYRKDEDHVVVEIADTGKGIPPEQINRVFEPFFTTKPVGKGTGLGLSVSYSIIERHHGSIAVRSEVGQGTCFTVTLPIHPPVAEPMAEGAAHG